jgi:Tfp pilus assembly protein PilF
MHIKALAMIICAVGLVGCVTLPVAPLPGQLPWHDQVFEYDSTLLTLGKQDLFALDADLLAALHQARLQKPNMQARLDYLVKLLYGAKNASTITEFPYQAGHSTVAAETWRRKRGDCLSLVILSYSLAKALDLRITMQEVQVPYTFDRHGGVDYIAGHVNLLIKNRMGSLLGERAGVGDLIIDFEPQIGSRREGLALSEDAILARFYNNLGAEYLVNGKLPQAYAHFKAAITADAGFAPSYVNLAVLYKRQGLAQSAERLLVHAIALNDDDDIAMGSLHQLLLAQGRDTEAAPYAKLIEARRERNPYYWIGLGLDQLQKGNYTQAINALENAQAISSGFQEVHRYLAIAYWRNGNQAEAKKQASLLSALSHDEAGDAALRKKIKKLLHN